MSGDNLVKEKAPGRTLSRIGRQPIPIPNGVQIEIHYDGVTVTGPLGTLTQNYHPQVRVSVENQQVLVERMSERKFHHSLHGLTRSLIANGYAAVYVDIDHRALHLAGPIRPILSDTGNTGRRAEADQSNRREGGQVQKARRKFPRFEGRQMFHPCVLSAVGRRVSRG